MTYKVLGRRAAQLDDHQPTQISRQLQLGGAGGIRPPGQRTLLGHSEDYGPEARHGIGGQQGNYQSTGGMQMSTPAYQAGSPGKPFYGAREKKATPPPRREEDSNRQQQEYYPSSNRQQQQQYYPSPSRKPPSKKPAY